LENRDLSVNWMKILKERAAEVNTTEKPLAGTDRSRRPVDMEAGKSQGTQTYIITKG
jgi:hypothetical protein